MTNNDIIYACFDAMMGDPDYEILVLLTYDEEQAKKWVAEDPQKPIGLNQPGYGRYYVPWMIGVEGGEQVIEYGNH